MGKSTIELLSQIEVRNTMNMIARVASRIANVDPKEGGLGVPVGQVISHLQKFLTAKYAIEMSYRSFADRVKGPWRDSIVDHWHEHAKDERDGAYQLAMKIVGLGGDPIQTSVVIPACPANVSGFCQLLLNQEIDAIAAGRELIRLSGDNTSLKVLAENLIVVDAHHADDLRRLAGSEIF